MKHVQSDQSAGKTALSKYTILNELLVAGPSLDAIAPGPQFTH